MTLRYSDKVRNAGIDARIAAIGPAPMLHITGADGERLASMTLPHEWMGAAHGGMARKRGSWSGAAARSGKAAAFEIRDQSDAEAHVSGKIPEDMTVDNPSFEKGQSVVVGSFVLAAGNGPNS